MAGRSIQSHRVRPGQSGQQLFHRGHRSRSGKTLFQSRKGIQMGHKRFLRAGQRVIGRAGSLDIFLRALAGQRGDPVGDRLRSSLDPPRWAPSRRPPYTERDPPGIQGTLHWAPPRYSGSRRCRTRAFPSPGTRSHRTHTRGTPHLGSFPCTFQCRGTYPPARQAFLLKRFCVCRWQTQNPGVPRFALWAHGKPGYALPRSRIQLCDST